MGLDAEACRQLRETRVTVVEALAAEPDDFKALLLADVLRELDPDRDPALLAASDRFRASRADGWQLRAKELGLDDLLYHLAQGWAAAGVGLAAQPVLELYAAEVGEARAAGVQPGLVDRSFVPEPLAGDPRAKILFHPSGHLARIELRIDANHEGRLTLAERPGVGTYRIVEERGGSGTMIVEEYRDGAVVTTLNTPWHDGVEARSTKAWTRWVEENLADLARLSASRPPASVGRSSGRSRRRSPR